MSARVIVLGATGRIGRLTAEALVRAGLGPVLAGPSAQDLVDLTAELAGLGPMAAPPTWQVADAADAAGTRALLTSEHDVLVSTVGTHARIGEVAVLAAIAAGCAYVDCADDPDFVAAVLLGQAARAETAGARLLPGFAAWSVPGHLAATSAIAHARERGHVPAAVRVAYDVGGPVPGSERITVPDATVRTVDVHATRPARRLWGTAPRTAGTRVDAIVTDAVGRDLAAYGLRGPDPTSLTADLLAWAAAMFATGREQATGALDPISAFGPRALHAACPAIGLVRTARS